ncbi:hypothetical protein [Magnetofaba australis]|uniref:Uncharacterized protein n=1 Tax=Magnetofaba australis IT-1 TaxID=1434232 RepID=A0A1Y2K400_9PROT|nr:hypothetical protein [Magnetofaba australis]OSM03949.1 hypothetical protein MAIT1_01016 [Magnetofaba australis IT-1]
MPNTILESITVRDLPEALRRAGFDPDEPVTITVQTEQERRIAAQALQACMDRISIQARENGLTDDKLEEILKDI